MYVHGNNLKQKKEHKTKYQDALSKKYLTEIDEKYKEWKKQNEELIGPKSTVEANDTTILNKRVELLEEYKNFVDLQIYAEQFDSRSNLHSSIIEEFMYYLFKDLVQEFSENALIGKSHVVKDFFFRANNYKEMIKTPNVFTEKKDHDFVIGVDIEANFICRGETEKEKESFQVPAVAIECKTYLDKTMLEGASNAANQLKVINPNGIYIVVAEWLKLTESINLKKYKVDQIYVLRKQKNTDREFRYSEDYIKNPIYLDVVEHLFNYVRNHLTKDWEGSISEGLSKGILV